ncbi:MAG: hypothetical protein QM763_22940 [Agriterribacter sp.]
MWIKDSRGREHRIVIRQAVDKSFAWVELPANIRISQRVLPAWNIISEQLQKAGITAPDTWHSDLEGGFVQHLPADLPLGVGWKRAFNKIYIASIIHEDPEEKITSLFRTVDLKKYQADAMHWWDAYWYSVPRITIPDPILQEVTDYGLYKQACTTPPHAQPAGLQGPFVEEYQLIPWANDYHFNINVQMIYTPAFASNRTQHLVPLWNMLKDWMPWLQASGKHFFGNDKALTIPHSVDDRGQVIGSFWTGTVDQGCTAWMAYMAWQHYRYTLDTSFLETMAWPLLNGAFEGFWSMLEEVEDSAGIKRFSLPVSVSPEYGSSLSYAWGRDASFQLSALHKVADLLSLAADILWKNKDTRWADVQKRLPPYTLVNDVWLPEFNRSGIRIGLWEGQDLAGSHRHHAHLAGIFPFYTIDAADVKIKAIMNNTIDNWVFKGSGNWAGWSFPWASSIWSRLENAEAAVQNLHYWYENFVNEGRGTLVYAGFKGTTLYAHPNWKDIERHGEIMQLDAGFDALNAVFEMLVQNRNGIIAVLPAIHRDWKNLRFENVLSERAFLISAIVDKGKTKEIRIKSQKGGLLKLDHRLGTSYFVNGKSHTGKLFEYMTRPGEVVVLSVSGH